MKIEIKLDSDLIEFCKLNNLNVSSFVYDCIEKGYVQNKWGRTPLDNSLPVTKSTKKKSTKKKSTEVTPEIIEQKKSEPVFKQTPKNDLYGED